MKFNSTLVLFFLITLTFGCQTSKDDNLDRIKKVTSEIDDQSLVNIEDTGGDWITHGRNYEEDRYSPLTQIDKSNISTLGLAWSIDLGVMRGIEASPIVVDGIMYTTGPWSVVYAIDVRKGEIIWEYDPEVDRGFAEKACCDVVNRGLAIYKGAVFVGVLDGRLISLDAVDGSVNWEVMTVPQDKTYTITGAPRIVKGRVVIGNGGAEFDARGFVSAYDASDGQLAWRFYTVPGDPSKTQEHPDLEEAAKTWTGEWWKMGGGGTVWDAIVYDPELNLIYIGVGNGAPWDRNLRSPEGGDNLYLSSIVALNADDGSYVWHYQTTPGDTWDFTATQPLILSDLEIEGALRKVIMQAPKNGFFYVIDRTDGSFISAEPYTYLNWAKGIDESGRPVEEDFARYGDGRNIAISPGPFGGHNWQPMTYSKATGLVYIPTHTISSVYSVNEKFAFNTANEGAASGNGWNVSFINKLYRPLRLDSGAKTNPLDPNSPYGRLIAYDPVKQEEVWAHRQTSHWNGGLLSTASELLFQGDAEGNFRAFDALSGDILWEKNLKTGIIAPPITYLVDGDQYVSVSVGWGGVTGLTRKFTQNVFTGTIYTFKIGGQAPYPEHLETPWPEITAMAATGTPVQIGRGVTRFFENCLVCHSDPGLGGGVVPDLLRSSDEVFEGYNSIVLDGILAQNGMPSFKDRLSEDDVESIRQYMLYLAKSLREQMPPDQLGVSLAQMQYLADTQPEVKD